MASLFALCVRVLVCVQSEFAWHPPTVNTSKTLNTLFIAKQYNALSDYAVKRSERYLFHLGQSLAFIYKAN